MSEPARETNDDHGASAQQAIGQPRWLKDFRRFLPLKSQFVLSGNIRDLHLTEVAPGYATTVSLLDCVAAQFRRTGYDHVIAYDLIRGFRRIAAPGESSSLGDDRLRELGLTPGDGRAPASIDLLGTTMERFVHEQGQPSALLVDFASRLASRPDALRPEESQLFTRALVLSHSAQARLRAGNAGGQPLFNTIVWIVEREGDLPDWLVIDNPRLRHVPIARPDHDTRRYLAAALLKSLADYREVSAVEIQGALDRVVDETERLLLLDIDAIFQLARSEALGVTRIGDAVRRFKVGVTEDLWAKIPRRKIRDAATTIRERVKGQDGAVTHALDIIKRSVTGIGAGRRGSRPRGIAFFAGPTGVGKTELAKTLTQLLFGDEAAMLRFDMSEFDAEHAAQRLIGAPPGYVGYDAGGELTNAIRERPFSLNLFDEIEKAHPRILDKFLQILDDGVLTSGRGERVFFSEAFIVFTSNLGIYRVDEHGRRVLNVSPDTPFAEVESKVRAEIETYFKVTLNRPELLNRLGDNIIVFDFIREALGREIFDGMVAVVQKDLFVDQAIELHLTEEALSELAALCLEDLSNGGRGIRNKLESHLINPLARTIFDQEIPSGSRLLIDGLERGHITNLRIRLIDKGAR